MNGAGALAGLSPSYRLAVLRETSLLPATPSPAEAFAAIWKELDIGSDWRAHRFLACDGGLFLKGNRVPSWSHPQMWMRRYHIEREFHVLRQLRDAGLSTAEPIAMGVELRGHIPVRSFLLEQRIQPALNLEEVLRAPSGRISAGERREILLRAGDAVRRMHRAGVAHGDLACRNLLVHFRPAGLDVVLLDLPRARLHPGRTPARMRRKDLYRIAKSALRCGASTADLTLLLGQASRVGAESIVASVRSIRSVRGRHARKLRIALWRAFGP